MASDPYHTGKPFTRGDAAFLIALAIGVLLLAGTCAGTAVRCWTRGGTVIKNAFDWPVCVEITRK